MVLVFYISLFFASIPSLATAQDFPQKVEIPESEPSVEETPEETPKAKTKLILKPIAKKTEETQPVTELESNLLILQGLNKVMGRVYTLEIPLGTIARFENLEIIARKCVKSKPEETAENSALLEIHEIKTGEEPKKIFLGWMFSSSPSLSSLEHPVYDVTVISCEARTSLE